MTKRRFFPLVLVVALLLTSWQQDAWAAATTRGPYLQMATPSSMVVRWRTDLATDSVVRFGDAPDNLILSETAPASTTEHEVTLTGLQPDTATIIPSARRARP